MPRTNDIGDTGSAESLVFDNLDVSQDDLSNDISDADADLGGDDGGDSSDYSSRSSDRGDRGSDTRQSQQRDPYPQRVPPSQQGQQRQQRQRDDLGRDGQQRVTHPQMNAGAEVRPDAQGNLIGPDGQIVARAGREARLYQRAANEGTERIKRAFEQEQYRSQKMQRDYQTLQGKMNELDGLLRSYEERDEAIKGLGLNPEHQVEAMRLFKQLTSDYPGTLRKLLTQAATRGVDVAGMANQGIDPKALTETLTEKFEALMKPLKERQEQEAAREAEEAEAARSQQELEEEVQDFFAQNQDAIPHAHVFLRVLEQPQYKNMSLGEIWARIQLSMARSPQQPAPNGMRNAPPQRRAVPNGRSHPQEGSSEMAPVTASYESILRDVIKNAGYR